LLAGLWGLVPGSKGNDTGGIIPWSRITHQSTIQRRIAELEESLGRRLVEPHGGGYRLTEELQSTPGCRRGLSLLSLRAPLAL
jgi:regulatory helix-turn-helix LysR family protein